MIESGDVHAVDDALVALQTALGAREIYWSEHAAARSALHAAFGLLRQALTAQSSICILFLPDRVVFNGRELASGARISCSLGRRLRERAIESLTFERTLSEDGLAGLLEELCTRSIGTDSKLTGVLLGRVLVHGADVRSAPANDRATGTSNRASVEDPGVLSGEKRVRAVSATQRLLSSVRTGSAPSEHRIEVAAENILEMLAACGGGVLPLAAVKSHDEYTYIHATNVAILSGALAETLGLAPDLVRDITLGALLHDVGKERLPLSILNKPGKLDQTEILVVQQHPVEGARILAGTEGVSELAIIIAYEHHMHLDGTGYPRPVAGRTTHLASRIVQFADVYDALGTHRPYRAAMSADKIRQVMSEKSGTAYERDLFGVFFEMVMNRITARDRNSSTTAPASSSLAA